MISVPDLIPSHRVSNPCRDHPRAASNALGRQAIAASNPADDPRLAEIRDWLDGFESTRAAEIRPASEDASFRRYFRVTTAAGSLIVMDAPPPQEDCGPFVRVAGYLEAMQLNAPRILEADTGRGFLLLSDLGSTHFLEVLEADPSAANTLYGDAIDALVTMQEAGAAHQHLLPPYDEALLRFELSLFHDWLSMRHLGLGFGDGREAAWQELCDLLVTNALEQPRVFVHRDYHSRNLMYTRDNNPGILDFQDAVEGPLTYDLVSLLRDCYLRWPPGQVHAWMQRFYARRRPALDAAVDEAQFLRWFDLMGVQRHLKAAGIFARLNHRDGKPGYMADVPRTLGYVVELGTRYPELGWLVDFVRHEVLPGLEQAP
jgi:aminoglycoside/choline kinase family phosphotransferase